MKTPPAARAAARFSRVFLRGFFLFTLFCGSLAAQPVSDAAVSAAPETPAALLAEKAAPQPPAVKVPASVTQGDAFCVLAGGKDIRGLSAELTDTSGKQVLACTGFRYSPKQKSADSPDEAIPPDGCWALVAGISSTAAPGVYTLSLRAVYEGGQEFTHTARMEITGRNFIREDIPLNEDMSSLRADPDPRKAAESRELWALLSSVNLASVYHAGKLILPVAAGFRETSFFGDRRTFLYTDGGKSNSIHYGLDYATPRGTPVHAAGAGKIVMAKERLLTGFSVVIEHLPGVYSLYYHLDKIDVKEGSMVSAGDKIGDSGFTGLATGPHLHWEIRAAGNAVEPKTLMASPFISR